MAELKRSINKVQINGIIAEMNLKESTKKVEIKKGDFSEEVTCKVIEKVEFKNPCFVIESNGSPINVEYFGANFGVKEKTFDDNGNLIDNKNFKALETILNKYVTKVNAKEGEEPTRVTVNGSLGLNEYASVNNNPDGEFYSRAEIVAFSISSSNVPSEDSADAEISGVIKNIVPETKDDEETGRIFVEFVSFGYNGVAEPFKFVVESDLAKDFEEYYEIGTSAKLYYEIKTRQVGSVRKVSGGFGRREAKITSGYTVQEFSIFRGDDAFEEDDEYFVSVETVQKALNEREMMKNQKIEDAVKKAKENGTTTTTKSASPSGASAKANPFGGETKRKNPFA